MNNAKAFTDAIKKMAAEECEKIYFETNEMKKERLKSLNEEAESRYADYVNYELTRIISEKNKKIAALEEESKKVLSALRKELTDKVFSKVKGDIEDFTKGNDYKDFLIECAKEIYGAMPDADLEFFLREKDIKFKEDINSSLGKHIHISSTNDISLGGIKAVNRETGCLLDNTLDIKLEEQMTWFLENSGLKI